YKQANDVTVHTHDNRWYAIIAGKPDSHAVTIIDVTNPNSPVEKAHIRESTDRTDTLLRNVNNVNTYKQTISTNERHFVAVGAHGVSTTKDDSGVQILEMVFLTANAGPDQAVLRGSSATLNASSTITTPGKTATYSWTQTGGPSVSLSNANTSSPTFTAPNQATTLTFRVTVELAASQGVVKSGHVTNAGIITATDTVTVLVSNGPTADAGTDQTVTVGDTVTIRGTAVTPNNNPLTYAWAHVSGPTVTPSNSAALQTTFTAPSSPGTIVLRFTVTDSTLSATDSDTVSIVVIPQQPPTANAGTNQTVTAGETVTLNGSGNDPNGDTLSYSWAKPVGSSVILSDNMSQNPTFTAPSSPGTITFTLTVSDGTLSDTDTVTITVTNHPPTANAGRDGTFAPESTVTLNGSGNDPDGNNADLTYMWRQTLGTPTVSIDTPTSAQTTFTAPADPTELVFTLTVSDKGNSATDDITITIKEQTQIKNIKEIRDTLTSAKITGHNQITMIYTEPIATFINSYLNFTITGEITPRNITGINGSPAIETGETIRIDGKRVKTYSTILTFDGEPVLAGSTGSMYIQHADHYLAKIHVQNGQN
ncbi:MAG: PKD domain-containing protein, partial [Thaumarchaeota archaeon]|nr:PKD domain-containing protein [Nitrososphaerota archaeon]